jgi:hypothetical protein
MSWWIKGLRKSSKQRQPMMMKHKNIRAYSSNQVRMHACYPTPMHCIGVFEILQENPQ